MSEHDKNNFAGSPEGEAAKMSPGLIVAGLGVAALGFAGRYLIRNGPQLQKQMNKLMPSMGEANNKFYRGGFEPKMSKREASLVLNLSPNAPKLKVKEAHKRIMLLNHPDRNGSPYLASKINEAKDLLDKK